MTTNSKLPASPPNPSRPAWLIPLLAGLAVLIVIGVILSVVMLNGSQTAAPTGQAKGGQLETPAASIGPTGPVEPTNPPPDTPSPTTAPPTPTATVAQATPTSLPSPTVIPTATPRPALLIVPKRIKIDAIHVNTFVERLGVDPKGNMDVPKNIFNVGWFGDGGYAPGDAGNAVIAGHLDGPGTRAVFWDLDKLKPGDKVVLSDDATELVFAVTDTKVYPYNNAPLQDIFGPSSEAHLNLITCNGTYDARSLNYNNRLVVFTKLVSP